MKNILLSIVCVVSISACAMSKPSEVDLSKVGKVKNGVTTVTQLENIFGKNYETDNQEGKNLIIYDAGSGFETSLFGPMKSYGQKLTFEVKNNIVQNYYIAEEKYESQCLPSGVTGSF